MLSLLRSIAFIAFATAQYVPSPTDLTTKLGYANVTIRYKEVPTGICEQDPNVKSYSGYADVEENEHIFWWFFEARNDVPSEAPLTVWINGGPGSSSMIGLFQENGPCFIDSSYQPYNNPYSWTNVTNMLYIDQPVQVGHSYSIPIPGYIDRNGDVVGLLNGDCPPNVTTCGTYSDPNQALTSNSTPNAAPNFWKTIQGFMGAFPEYSREEFYFTTESYGGHYGPIFSEYIEQQNQDLPDGAQRINLDAVLIGNGWFDPLIQYAAYYNFSVSPGNTYDFELLNKTIQDLMYNNVYGHGNCVDQIQNCYSTGDNAICIAADLYCIDNVENLYDIYSGRDEYDMRELTPDPFPPEFFVQYLNTPKVQQAIGAFVNFTEFNGAVGSAFGSTGDDARKFSIIEDMGALLDQGVAVILYSGDADYICNWRGTDAVSREVEAPGFDEAGYTDIITSDGVVHGQVKQAADFSHVRIYESGHEVPFYQPLVSLEMLKRVIDGKDIATGRVLVDDSYLTQGEAESTYHEGNRTVQLTVVPVYATYNTTTNAPNPWNGTV